MPVAPKTGMLAQDPPPQEETGGVSTLPKAQDDSEGNPTAGAIEGKASCRKL